MLNLNLKPGPKAVKTYYHQLQNVGQLSLFNEGAVAPAFAGLLRYCAGPVRLTLVDTLFRDAIVL
jgi:hypothetical protein